MGFLAVMGSPGDVRTEWDPENPDEIEAVRLQFDALKNKGYLMFAVHDDKKGALYDAFAPLLGKAIFAKQIEPAVEAIPAEPGPGAQKVKADEKPPEGKLDKFDPKAEKIVATPPARGG